MKDLSKMTCLEDLRRVAQRKVPKMFYDYVVSGSWSESTLHANRNDFQAIKLRQRVLVDMEGRSLESTMIGQQVKMPLAIAPTGFTGMVHPDGEIHAARAAEKFGIPFLYRPCPSVLLKMWQSIRAHHFGFNSMSCVIVSSCAI